MKLRITEPGFETVSSPIAEVMFENGVSVGEVSEDQALRISAAMRCETLEGVNPSAAAVMLREMNTRAGVVVEMARGAEVEDSVAIAETPKPAAPVALAAPTHKYTREELEQAADKGGIKGLRAIAAPFGVKGVGIKELIDETLQAQAKFIAEAA